MLPFYSFYNGPDTQSYMTVCSPLIKRQQRCFSSSLLFALSDWSRADSATELNISLFTKRLRRSSQSDGRWAAALMQTDQHLLRSVSLLDTPFTEKTRGWWRSITRYAAALFPRCEGCAVWCIHCLSCSDPNAFSLKCALKNIGDNISINRTCFCK